MGNGAGVEGICAAAGNFAQGGSVGRVGEGAAQGLGAAVGIEVQRQRIGIGLQRGFGTGQCVSHAAADLEAIGGQVNTRLHQVLPGLAAVILVRQIEHAHSAGCANGTATGSGARCWRGLVAIVYIAQIVRSSCGGGGFAPVIGRYFLAGRIVVQHEGAAANTARLRLDQAQHHLHGDSGVNSRSTRFEHLATGFRR